MSEEEAKRNYIAALNRVNPTWRDWKPSDHPQSVTSSDQPQPEEGSKDSHNIKTNTTDDEEEQMTSNTQRKKKIWGWGYEDVELEPAFVSKVTEFLLSAFDITEEEFKASKIEPPTIDDIKLRKPRFDAPSDLAHLLSSSPYDRALHSFGRSFRDVVRCLKRQYDNPPDYVAFPKTEADIQSIMQFCEKNRIALIPFGGGSTVVAGVEPPRGDTFKGVITLSMQHFDKIMQVDTISRTALIQGGMYGPKLESELKKRGLTLRHFPQSFEFSTLGGWIATRGGGHYATLFTHIDEFVECMRVVTPKGVVQTNRYPASGSGPNPDRLFIGSEGIFGVITEAWMKLVERPIYRSSATIRFKEFMKGAEAVREISQSGLNPSNCRLVDAVEAMYMGLGDGVNSVLIVGFESATLDNFDLPMSLILKICSKWNGVYRKEDVSTKSGESGDREGAAGNWRNNFLKAPYLRDYLTQHGLIIETFETACTWNSFPVFHEGVRGAVEEAIQQFCEGKGLITCRFTHAYPDGIAPYYSVIAKPKKGMDQLQCWDKIKEVASLALLKYGGTITHHHSVGKDHQLYYQKQENNLFLSTLSSTKNTVDPKWIMNPGVLLNEKKKTNEGFSLAWPNSILIVAVVLGFVLYFRNDTQK